MVSLWQKKVTSDFAYISSTGASTKIHLTYFVVVLFMGDNSYFTLEAIHVPFFCHVLTKMHGKSDCKDEVLNCWQSIKYWVLMENVLERMQALF